ncbi:MAG: SH3 domain-containing protein [Candidatus Latescibacteria bacterium]|nr:SH3 domain-containing protein [Candidatus Latescibacterota bacterium]
MNRIFLCLIALLIIAGTSYAQDKKLITAPDVIPPATEAMQHPEFWIDNIDGDPDRIILTPKDIVELNRKAANRPVELKDINGNPFSIQGYVNSSDLIGLQFYTEDPLAITSVSGDSLRARFRRTREHFLKRTYWDRRYLKYSEGIKQEIIDRTDESTIPETVVPRYGILTSHTLNRVMPEHQAGFGSQYGWLDMLQSTSLETGTPVAVLHMSKNRDWCYVKSYHSFGWVPTVQVAFGTIGEIRRLSESDKFIVALAHKVPVYSDRECIVFVTDIYQSARLNLVRETGNGYNVLMPFRRGDGSLETLSCWVKPNADIHVGYQPFTQRNIINTFFRLLNRPYSWMGAEHERSCSGTVRSVLKTFGILAARGTSFELHYPDHIIMFPKETAKDIKYQYLNTCEPAITLCGFSGHIMLYLGKVDGVHYIIHQNGYSYHDENGTELKVGRVSVNHTELEGGSDINLWTELSVLKP